MSSDDRSAIEQTIQTCFDGLYDGDAEKLAAVFDETSALTFEHDGKVTALPLAQWLKLVRERPAPKAKGLPRDDAILLIDQSGPTTAFAKVKCQIPPRYVQKVFATVVKSWDITGEQVCAERHPFDRGCVDSAARTQA